MKSKPRPKKEKFRVTTKDFACVFKIENDTILEIPPPLQQFQDSKIYLLFEWLESRYPDSYKLVHAK